MQIPETPRAVQELDLMKRLYVYANGQAQWDREFQVGADTKQACNELHANICQLVNKVLAPLLDRITVREMDTFTMHDRIHGLKVAHLMWHILGGERRERLTPSEIALLVLSAHLHDLGMALSKQERAARLSAESDLWDKLEVQEATKAKLDQLRKQVGDPTLGENLLHTPIFVVGLRHG